MPDAARMLRCFRGHRHQTGMDRRNRRFTMKWCEPEAVEAMENDPGPDRPDTAISSADAAAGTQESARRNRADADIRRGHAVLRRHPGGTAHGVSQRRPIPKPGRQSVAPLLSAHRNSLRRSCAGTRQFRPDIARLPGGDLGMDQQIAIADAGAGILRRDESRSRHGQCARSPPHRGRLSVQGRQMPREHAGFRRSRRADAGWPCTIYRVARRDRRSEKDRVRLADCGCHRRLQRSTAGQHR